MRQLQIKLNQLNSYKMSQQVLDASYQVSYEL